MVSRNHTPAGQADVQEESKGEVGTEECLASRG